MFISYRMPISSNIKQPGFWPILNIMISNDQFVDVKPLQTQRQSGALLPWSAHGMADPKLGNQNPLCFVKCFAFSANNHVAIQCNTYYSNYINYNYIILLYIYGINGICTVYMVHGYIFKKGDSHISCS